MNKFMLNETSYHGAGAITAIPAEIKARGFKKAFVASDPDLIRFGITAKVTDLLDKEGIVYETLLANDHLEMVEQFESDAGIFCSNKICLF
jgi:alcohol dehydrogenase class IV